MTTTTAMPPKHEETPTAGYRRRRSKAGNSLLARGEPMLWLTGGALMVCLLMITSLLVLVVWKGAGTFWPRPLIQISTYDNKTYLGEVTDIDHFVPTPVGFAVLPDAQADRIRQQLERNGGVARRRLLRTGNFDLTGVHFNWVTDFAIAQESRPQWAVLVERQSWGRFYGFPAAIVLDGETSETDVSEIWAFYQQHHGHVRERWQRRRHLETEAIGQVNERLEASRLRMREAEMTYGQDSEQWRHAEDAYQQMEAWSTKEFKRINQDIRQLNEENERYKLIFQTVDKQQATIPLADIVRAFPANQLTRSEKLRVYLSRWWEFLSDEPREANSEGGVFPAIFGTVLMTLLMSIVVVPFGVLAALYLREYAKAGPIVSAVRIAVNNLAGVPSIVFGVFGLGFFCYGLGSYVDAGPGRTWPRAVWLTALAGLVLIMALALVLGFVTSARLKRGTVARRYLGKAVVCIWIAAIALLALLIAKTPFFDGLYQANLPNPTFGKGALIWASVTLALLTLPVVIVATEEALAAVPNSMREGSYACGASKWQTIRRIVLPRAMPGIMTGMILAMARGAGEVAPLMLVGAVKLAPELPIDLQPPFGLNRSFMHLGFHIYDLGFQSQNSEAAKPMVFTTTLLLILLIATLNIAAVWLRSRLQRKFVTGQF